MKKCFRFIAVSSVIAVSLALSGCGAHPSSGAWVSQAASGSESAYSSVKLEFDGTGTVRPNTAFAGQENSTDLRCVWQAKSANSVDVECRGDTVTKMRFELIVTEEGDEGHADLLQDGKRVASFVRG